MRRIPRLAFCAAALSLALASVGASHAGPAAHHRVRLATAADTTENDALTFHAATWVDLQRVTGADPGVDVDTRGNGRVFVDFPWGRLTTPTLPNIVARSLDHGDTFRTLFQEDCPTSNSQPHCGDPGMGNSALALSPDTDNVYLSGIVPGFGSLTASASSNAGDTWPRFNPVTTPGVMDRPWLLAPAGRTAYLTWNNVALSGLPSVQYATTTDGGASWNVDPKPKYAAAGATRLVMDRSAQSPARGAIYQVFAQFDSQGNAIPRVGIAVSTDATKTFQTHDVGGDLACAGCQGDYHGFSLPWVTTDTAGNLYVVWGTESGSDVVMSTSNISDPANDPTKGGSPGSTWSSPVRVSTGAAETAVVGNVVAGSPGNVAIVYYATKGSGIPDTQPDDAEWHPFVAHSANALSSSPQFTQSVITHRVVHTGPYCTDGSGGRCSRDPRSHDRGLRNWMRAGMDPDGRLYAAWSDDNNDGNRTGIRFAKQLTGPSLIAGTPPFSDPAPSTPMADPSGDATWLNRISGGTSLPGVDLTRVAVHQDDTTVRFTMRVADARRFQQALDAVPSADRLLFLIRFQSGDQDYFAAYEYPRIGQPRAFTGRIEANEGFDASIRPAAIDFRADPPSPTSTVNGNTITITQQRSAFGNPQKLLSVVGATLIGPSESRESNTNLLNTIDASRAFDHDLM